jgi:hypothetical protein
MLYVKVVFLSSSGSCVGIIMPPLRWIGIIDNGALMFIQPFDDTINSVPLIF